MSERDGGLAAAAGLEARFGVSHHRGGALSDGHLLGLCPPEGMIGFSTGGMTDETIGEIPGMNDQGHLCVGISR